MSGDLEIVNYALTLEYLEADFWADLVKTFGDHEQQHVDALAQESMGDVEILNFARTLEYLEADFYKQAQKLDLDETASAYAQEFGAHEQAHVEALTQTITDLGGTPAELPTFTFPLEDQADFLELAQTLEDTGVSAYNGAGPSIESKDVLAAAGSIVQVEESDEPKAIRPVESVAGVAVPEQEKAA